VKDGINGYLVPVADVEAMADKIICCIKDATLRKRLSEGAEKTAKELFSPSGHKAKLAEVFDLVK